jgi:hypothetical protein
LIVRSSHAYTQSLCFISAGNDTTVIVAENNNRPVPEIRPEYPFAGAIETITVNNSVPPKPPEGGALKLLHLRRILIHTIIFIFYFGGEAHIKKEFSI